MQNPSLNAAAAERYQALLEMVEPAAQCAMDYFVNQASLVTEAKAAPMDVVSQADRETETMIRTALRRHFPNDGLIGEEGGIQIGSSPYRWVIDPIDGTLPFLSGLPHWCVAIALLEHEKTVAAVTLAPVSGLCYSAYLGGGFWINQQRQPAIKDRSISGNMTAVGGSHWANPAELGACVKGILEAGGLHYRNGSGALMLAEVAASHLAGYYEPYMKPWDCLGGLLMVNEAGGVTNPIDTASLLNDGHEILAATPSAFSQLQQITQMSKTEAIVK